MATDRFIIDGGSGTTGASGDEWGDFATALAYGSWTTGDTLEIETGIVWRETVVFDSSWGGYNLAITIKSDTPSTYAQITPAALIVPGDWTAVGDGEYWIACTSSRVTFIEDGVRIPGRHNYASGTDPDSFFPQIGSLSAGEFAVDTVANRLYYRPTGDALDKNCELTQGSKSGIAFEDTTGLLVIEDIHGYGGSGEGNGGMYFTNCRNFTVTRGKGSSSWRHGVIADRTCDNYVWTDVWADDVFWQGCGQVGPAPNDWTLSSLTSVTTTATGTTPTDHLLKVGDEVRIEGATQTEYNGDYTVVSVPTTKTFTYTFAGSGTSPATGTIACTDITIRQMTMNTIKSTRVNWLKTDMGDGNAIIIQPYKNVTGNDWTIETVGNVTYHTSAHKDYISANNLGGLLANGAAVFDTANGLVDGVYAKTISGNGLQLSGSEHSIGVYTPTVVARNIICEDCGLSANTIKSTHCPIGIYANKDSTLDATVNGAIITGGDSGDETGLSRGAIDIYSNDTATGATVTAKIKRVIVTGTTGDYTISINEESNCVVNYTGDNNRFNSGGANPYYIKRDGVPALVTDLAGWQGETGQDAVSTEGDPGLIVGADANKETAEVYPTTYGAVYHAGQSISALNDYHNYAFVAANPTIGAIEFKSGTVKSTATGIYLPSFDTIAVWTA